VSASTIQPLRCRVRPRPADQDLTFFVHGQDSTERLVSHHPTEFGGARQVGRRADIFPLDRYDFPLRSFAFTSAMGTCKEVGPAVSVHIARSAREAPNRAKRPAPSILTTKSGDELSLRFIFRGAGPALYNVHASGVAGVIYCCIRRTDSDLLFAVAIYVADDSNGFPEAGGRAADHDIGAVDGRSERPTSIKAEDLPACGYQEVRDPSPLTSPHAIDHPSPPAVSIA